jgi:hypothetical protein
MGVDIGGKLDGASEKTSSNRPESEQVLAVLRRKCGARSRGINVDDGISLALLNPELLAVFYLQCDLVPWAIRRLRFRVW